MRLLLPRLRSRMVREKEVPNLKALCLTSLAFVRSDPEANPHVGARSRSGEETASRRMKIHLD